MRTWTQLKHKKCLSLSKQMRAWTKLKQTTPLIKQADESMVSAEAGNASQWASRSSEAGGATEQMC